MKNSGYLDNKRFGYITVIILYAVYIALFAVYYDEAGIAVAALATIPVIGAGWYFGSVGGMLTAILLILSNLAILVSDGYPAFLV